MKGDFEQMMSLLANPDSFIDCVEEFHRTFDVLISEKPSIPPADIKELRKKLIREEYEELIKAIDDDDIISISDAGADLHYVVSGTMLSYGIPENEVFAEVHRSNMSKADPDGTVHKRPDGKILKSEHYSPANIRPIIEKAMR